MAAKHVLAAVVGATLVVLSTAAPADEYRPHEFLSLDLSRAVLSPKRLGPPTEFAPVAVQARTESTHVVVEPKADQQRAVRTSRMTEKPVAKPRGAARAKVVRRHGNPLDAQAFDRSIQTWPCKSGGICNWKR
ncbi:hypothetical protein [Bradyrhizobium sp.]|uniref:hypothetical protein n=1 Tax=Bradyrhizobium sp. TaxID=376 RepID=UPI004037C5BC